MSISTGGGDAGQTSLTGGQRVSKHSQRVTAYGTIDELNSLIGIILAEALCGDYSEALLQIQHDLFELGTDVSTPADNSCADQTFRIGPSQVQRLEQQLAEAAGKLPPLREFILPGGSRAAAWLHLARTVARRAEREVVAVLNGSADTPPAINADCLTYLNRLSDLLFQWARLANDGGQSDVVWKQKTV